MSVLCQCHLLIEILVRTYDLTNFRHDLEVELLDHRQVCTQLWVNWQHFFPVGFTSWFSFLHLNCLLSYCGLKPHCRVSRTTELGKSALQSGFRERREAILLDSLPCQRPSFTFLQRLHMAQHSCSEANRQLAGQRCPGQLSAQLPWGWVLPSQYDPDFWYVSVITGSA